MGRDVFYGVNPSQGDGISVRLNVVGSLLLMLTPFDVERPNSVWYEDGRVIHIPISRGGAQAR